MLVVYQVDWTFCDLTTEQIEAAGVDRLGYQQIHDEWDEAAAWMRACVERVDGSVCTVERKLMTRAEYDALPEAAS